MKLTVLMDNISNSDRLVMEHGLSYYIETGSCRILFDTGQSGNFIHNAMKLGINIAEIDYLVLSHGHSDHTGGVENFLKFNSCARIIVKREALQSKYSGNTYIGIPYNSRIPDKRVVYVDDYYTIDSSTEVIGTIQVAYSEDTHYEHFFIKAENRTEPDTFQDEVFLAIKSNEGLSVITGCSHNGICNIIHTSQERYKVPIKYVMGGLHLKDANRETVKNVAAYLNSTQVEKIITGHCTGMENCILLKNRCKAQVSYGFAGNSYTL